MSNYVPLTVADVKNQALISDTVRNAPWIAVKSNLESKKVEEAKNQRMGQDGKGNQKSISKQMGGFLDQMADEAALFERGNKTESGFEYDVYAFMA